jgi:nitrite reductase/ring-hydroxylating ferredoxin subunit
VVKGTDHLGTRRELLRQAVVVAGVPCACLGSAKAPCCKLPDAPPAAVRIDRDVVRLDLDRMPELRRTGSAVKVIDESRNLYLLIAHPEKHQFVALDQKCTHYGGPLTYVHERRLLHCTCWGHARFGLDGRILFWPNSKPGQPLRVHRLARAGNILEIRVDAPV